MDVLCDGILRERCEHARGRNFADCGWICGSLMGTSFGSIEEMWTKYSKLLTMHINTVKKSDNFVEKC